MTKAGLKTFTRYAARESASDGMQINYISCWPLFIKSLSYAKANKKENNLMEEKIKKM